MESLKFILPITFIVSLLLAVIFLTKCFILINDFPDKENFKEKRSVYIRYTLTFGCIMIAAFEYYTMLFEKK